VVGVLHNYENSFLVIAGNQYLVSLTKSDILYVIKKSLSLMSIAVDRHIKSYLWCQLLISVDIKDQFSIIKRIHEHRSKLVRPRSGAAVVDLPLIYAAACQGWRTLPTITEAHVACRRGPPSRSRLPHPWATVPTSTVHPHCRR
jgi:hypothetical protein